VNHEETAVDELDADDLQRDTVQVGSEKDDEIRLVRIR
jgi:hypothetical protein